MLPGEQFRQVYWLLDQDQDMRRRGGLTLRPINSVKNIVDNTSIGVAAATNTAITVATVVNAYAGGVSEVPIGAKVRSLYLFFQIIPQAVQGNVDVFVIRKPAGVVNPVPGATGGAPERKFILHEEKGIPGIFNNGAGPLTFKGVIKIPKGRQRMAEGDLIQVVARCSSAYDFCLKCIYKFYQ